MNDAWRHEPRDKQGQWTDGGVRLIRASDLSSGDARRSRQVSKDEFARLYAAGKAKIQFLKDSETPATALDGARWQAVKDNAWQESRAPWGGVTVDSHTGHSVTGNEDKYALTVRDPGMESVTVSPSASRAEFDAAMDQARKRFQGILRRPNSHLGVFHDADLNRIDIDPVMVTGSLQDVEEIGAYTHAVGGAYHFKSGDGFWPPHVKDADPVVLAELDRLEGDIGRTSIPFGAQDALRAAVSSRSKEDLQRWLNTYGEQLPTYLYNDLQSVIHDLSTEGEPMASSIYTPTFGGVYDLSLKDGKIAFWKQILPKRMIHYTAHDGSRKTLNFDERYLMDLANNKAVDKVGFLLADVDNRHTMDPERWRGEVAEWEIRDNEPNPDHNGLYGKIVFPNAEAARAVLSNPDLGVSARIREGIAKSDGSLISRGIIHVLGTLDPQVSGMAGWQTADLSNEDDFLLDLTAETYEDGTMAQNDNTRSVTDYTEDEIAAMSEEDLNAFLAQAEEEFAGILDEVEADLDDEDFEYEEEPVTASLSNEAQSQIDLANSRANRALQELAQAKWDRTRDAYMSAGVPVDLLDLAEPIFNRPNDFIVDLSNEGTAGEVNVGEIVARLLDAAKGTVDLSNEQGHGGTFKTGDGEDPDKQLLDMWEQQG